MAAVAQKHLVSAAALLVRFRRDFARAREGNIALLAALILPPVAVAAVAAIQLFSVWSTRSLTQGVADSAAEWGAEQLQITPVGADSRTQGFALGQLQSLASQVGVTVNATATEIDAHTMKVAVDTNMPSFFGNVLPAGGFNVHSEATAVGASQAPLCVLVIAPVSADNLHITGTSRMQSTCLVISDSTLTVDAGASLTAGSIQTAAAANGTMTPAAQTGAPNRADPFASLITSPPATCSGPKPGPTAITGSQTLPPGTYCGDVNIGGGASLTVANGAYVFGGNVSVSGGSSLTLTSGQFYFAGTFTVSGNSTVTGTDAVLDFYQGSTGPAPSMSLSGGAIVSISGRQSGSLAGFVLIVDRTVSSNFQIQTDFINKLTGAVYSPDATLSIQGAAAAIAASDWTVIDAASLQLVGSPNVVINSNYSGSSVPVPSGVGNNMGQTRVTR